MKTIPELLPDANAPIYLNCMKLLSFLGKGGHSLVLLAQEYLEGKYLAVKIPKKEKDVIYLQQEALALSQLSHPGIVAFHNLYRANEQGMPALSWEYCQGITLQQALEHSGPLDEEMTRYVGHEVVCALSYIHNKGLIHQDVAPANILLTSSGTKLLDFGNVQFLKGRSYCYCRYSQPLGYAAPEKMRLGIVSPASDFYSLGITLLGCSQGTDDFAEMSSKPPRMTPGLAELISGLLSERPQDRYEAARKLS